MTGFFKNDSHHTKRARILAMLWTLLILFLCFLPGRDLPEVNVPLIDKWAHVILFGVFTFLWHSTVPTRSYAYKIILLAVAIFLGGLVEYVQGHYVPQRSQDMMDVLADGIGGILGIIVYTAIYARVNRTVK
ncbi:MAG: hypothetical protein BGO70_12760 [Bacteroidetes bacterium 43-93]|nr:VanZ family protein [Bacteroidota bacterium]OJW99315.1 MAG: hypothetical protein BGO70_12760 [Bacteroidetes bacterium 43-93]